MYSTFFLNFSFLNVNISLLWVLDKTRRHLCENTDINQTSTQSIEKENKENDTKNTQERYKICYILCNRILSSYHHPLCLCWFIDNLYFG